MSPHSSPLQFYNPTRRLNSDNGISKFANLKSYFISSVSCSGQCFMEAMKTFLIKLVLLDSDSVKTCGPVWKRVKSWRVIQRYDVYIQIQKIEGQKSPLLLFTVPKCPVEKDQVPRGMATVWHRSRTCSLLREEVLLREWSVFSLGLLGDKIWPDLSLLRSFSLCIPQHCFSVILLLLGTGFFPWAMHLCCWYPGPQGMTPSQGLGLGKKPVISE